MTYRFIGDGYVPGIPARDLTDQEAKEYGAESSPAYERVSETRKKADVKPLPQGEFLPDEETDDE